MDARRVATARWRHAQHDSAPGRPAPHRFARQIVQKQHIHARPSPRLYQQESSPLPKEETDLAQE